MRLALFSQEYTQEHDKKLSELLGKELNEVKLLYINTAINYKPYKPDWYLQSENWYREKFTQFKEFEIERAYKVDPNFNFKEYFSNFDFIVFSGGNTFLLAYWLHKTKAGESIIDLVSDGKVVYGGESAGATVVTSNITPYSTADDPGKAPERVEKGLEIIDFAVIPHWGLDGFGEILSDTEKQFKGLGIETTRIKNNQGMFYVDGEITIV